MKNLCVIIPALKKNAIIPDQLVKKLHGVTLIQRAINTAKELVDNKDIVVVTDSEEISLICERNHIKFYYNAALTLDPDKILRDISFILEDYARCYESLLIYRANAPLVDSKIIKDAYQIFLKNQDNILVSVRKVQKKIFRQDNHKLADLFDELKDEWFEEIRAFLILPSALAGRDRLEALPYVLPDDRAIEIQSYQDWWICEKLLQRKRIVFNVIGSVEIGMGHVYRSLTLAHEITDHEIIFVCDEKYKIVVDKIASTDYRVIAKPTRELLPTILDLNPDLVINDILNTDKKYILTLKEAGIKVVNFEDLGEGSRYTDLTINELYEEPQIEGKHYLWGHKYYFLRDEFDDARPHEFFEDLKAVLITFGGADQNNLTLYTLKAIVDLCRTKQLKIYIVCGAGYQFKTELENYINQSAYKDIELTYATGVISRIMEKTQIAITSNGRTVYELADMNIPSIIISHHEREATHSFATLEKGFLNLGIFDPAKTMPKLIDAFEKLVLDSSYRQLLFLNIKRYSFRKNKQRVLWHILRLLEG
jgi:spore coat polysaccharide biosynthesis predicted glycosyltransferase SpsG/CMP-N-acetylneuraminic acid synthetase